MLTLTIPSTESYDELNNTFVETKLQILVVEHSLISLSKWESTWKIPFLSKDNAIKTNEQSLDYIRCMTISSNVDPEIYRLIPNEIISQVNAYIDDPMTATTIAKRERPITKEIITSEIIYHWMIAFNIPFECQKWHLNRLLTLINVCDLKNQPAKKMSQAALIARNRSLNDARKAQLGTGG